MNDQRAPSAGLMPARRLGTSHILLSVGVLFLLHTAIVYPGIMSWDSKFQYHQAFLNEFNDWFPPIMAWLWRLLLPISYGGSALLIIPLALYWASFGIIAITFNEAERPRFALATIAIGLVPGALLLSSFLYKDVGHAVTLMVAFALTLQARTRHEPLGWARGICIALLLLYATLVRSNGVIAAAPIACYAWFPGIAHTRLRIIWLTAATGGLVVLSVPLSHVVNNKLIGATRTDSVLSIVHFDLAGIAHYSGDLSIYPAPRPKLATLERCYDPQLWDALNMRSDCLGELGIHNGAKNKKKSIAWLKAIGEHPVAYAIHRIRHFNETMYFIVPWRTWYWAPFIDPVAGPVPDGRIQHFTEHATDVLMNNPIFAPATCFVLELATLLMLAFRPHLSNCWRQGAFYAGFAGSIYAAGYLIVGVASMYRYQQLTLTWAPLSALLLFAGSPRSEWRTLGLSLGVPTAVTALVVGASRLML